MLTLNLMPVFKARGIEKAYTFLVKNGFAHHTALNVLNNKVKVIKIEHIEKLCRLLICEPHDLFLWTPDKKRHTADDLLQKLNQADIQSDVKAVLENMSLEQLKEISDSLTNK